MRSFGRFWLLLYVTLLPVCGKAIGQSTATPQVPTPAWDVISVKVDRSGDGRMSFGSTRSSVTMVNVPLQTLLTSAYPVRWDRVSGLPGWAEGARFDIGAKLVDPDAEMLKKLTEDQLAAMKIAILTDRFHLRAHTEDKVLPAYELVVAKGGATLHEAAPLGPDADPAARKARGMFFTRPGSLNGAAMEMSSFAANLANMLDRDVIDRTGLTGAYDINLKFNPEQGVHTEAPDAPPPIFTALEEQLGLKLVPTKAPAKVLVVEHVEMPTEN